MIDQVFKRSIQVQYLLHLATFIFVNIIIIYQNSNL